MSPLYFQYVPRSTVISLPHLTVGNATILASANALYVWMDAMLFGDGISQNRRQD
jgi:uncharacterized protein YgfB (UPF0149 family)